MKKVILSLLIAGCLILSAAAYFQENKIATSNVTGYSFERVDLHGDIIKEASFLPKIEWTNTVQAGGLGLAEAAVLNGGTKGSSQLLLENINGFGAGQLITYEGVNGQFYTTVIASMESSAIVLKLPLEVSISNPQKIWSFYADPDHPNEYGYKAIADYALRNLRDLNSGKHVLFGDSWFDHYPRHLSGRLSNKLPKATIINAGKGGNTTQNLLDRFDSAVTSQKPNTVWIMAGNNDYNQSVSKENYINNIQKLIRKINHLGARAIVFNASVGKPLTHTREGKPYPSTVYKLQELSHDYYNELENMLNQ